MNREMVSGFVTGWGIAVFDANFVNVSSLHGKNNAIYALSISVCIQDYNNN